jgi:hypothetical protein
MGLSLQISNEGKSVTARARTYTSSLHMTRTTSHVDCALRRGVLVCKFSVADFCICCSSCIIPPPFLVCVGLAPVLSLFVYFVVCLVFSFCPISSFAEVRAIVSLMCEYVYICEKYKRARARTHTYTHTHKCTCTLSFPIYTYTYAHIHTKEKMQQYLFRSDVTFGVVMNLSLSISLSRSGVPA